MTLSILDELTPGNLTGGKQVAVTGEIAPDGTVLEVGGVGQKAVAARHRGAQLFIVPIGRGRRGRAPAPARCRSSACARSPTRSRRCAPRAAIRFPARRSRAAA